MALKKTGYSHVWTDFNRKIGRYTKCKDRRKSRCKIHPVVQSGVFSLGGYFQLIKGAGCTENAQPFIGKGEEIVQIVENSLHFAKKYQDLGINEPRWQGVNYVLQCALPSGRLTDIPHSRS